jgi:hypothetical protein
MVHACVLEQHLQLTARRMAAVAVPSMSLGASQSAAALTNDFPPVAFVYQHLHDSIRAELAQLSSEVQGIEAVLRTGEDVIERLVDLRKRYQMLVQVNRYHSSVEDEVRREGRPNSVLLHHHMVACPCLE